MRHLFLIVALVAALLPLDGRASAQQQSQQDVPDAPQPHKKPAAKATPDAPSPAAPADAPPAKQPAGKDDNAFPEAVSRDAASKASEQEGSKPPADGSSTPQTPAAKAPGSQANPFPEDVSRDAAKAAGNDPAPPAVPKSDLPPGVSSSQSQGSNEGEEKGLPVIDPAKADKDNGVGSFYLKTGNYQGALQRFKDASAADPTNVAAIFGLAESQRMLGKTAEAARNYQLYLDIVPNGPKARESMKALKTLQATK